MGVCPGGKWPICRVPLLAHIDFSVDVPLHDRPSVGVEIPFGTASVGQAVPLNEWTSSLPDRCSGTTTRQSGAPGATVRDRFRER